MPVPVFSTGEVLTAANMNAVGLWRVTGCTVTSVGGTAATASNGVVTIGTGNTSVTVNNAFSSSFDNYEIVYQMGDSDATAALFVKFNNSTGSTYSYGGGYTLFGVTSFVAEQANNAADGVRIGNTNIDLASCVFQVISPFLATPTHVMSQHADAQYFSLRGGRDSNAASQTGFTLVAPGATLTGGTIRVYGKRN